MWEWLENTSVAIWVGESLWAYPFWLSLHAIGLAVVVGVFAMRDLRLLGMFRGLAPRAFLSLSKFAWIGFVINATSGTLLFVSQASTFAHSTPFLIKIACIIAGMILASIIQARLRNELAEAGDEAAIPGSLMGIAVASLLI